MSEVADSTRSRSSPKKKRNIKKNHGRLQLYNPSHKKDLIKLFAEIKAYRLNNEDSNSSPIDEKSENNQLEASDDEENELPVDTSNADEDVKTKSGNLNCNSCGIFLDDVAELRSHCKLDWHRYNVKRKFHGQSPISETQFNEMIDDLSSIEGSDSEEDSQIDTSAAVSRLMEKVSVVSALIEDDKLTAAQKSATSVPKSYFENGAGQIFGVYNSIFEAVNVRPVKNITEKFQNILETPLKVGIIMVSGGHFAAAVFHGNETVLHKTFHSYTVRKQQGGSQGAKDAKGSGHHKSAGASLRRYNEQSFQQHVDDLMDSWKTKLAECDIIFYRAVGSSSNVLFGGKSPALQRSDVKLQKIPFLTRRPTLMEVKRVLSLLTVLHIYENQAQFILEHQPKSKKSKGNIRKKEVIDRAKSRSPKRHPDPVAPLSPNESESEGDGDDIEIVDEEIDFSGLKEFDDSLTTEERQAKRKRSKPKKSKLPVEPFPKPPGVVGELLDALTSSNSEAVGAILVNLKTELQNLQPENALLEVNQAIDFDGSNLLHLASHTNSLDAIWDLLESGCDPAVKNKSGKCPYNLAETKESRSVFRRFMGQFPDKFDYKLAQVPAPLTEEIEAEKAEKKKLLNKLKREKEKQKKLEKKEKEKEVNEKDRFLKLSDREKRALAAEQRILDQCKRNGEKQPVLVRCFECACDLSGKVPFEYGNNIFCTTKCLTEHRKKFPVPLSV